MSKATKLPAGWSVGTMDDVVAGIVAGTSVNCDDRKFEDGDKRVLKLSAVSGGRLKPSDYKVVSRAEHSRLKTPLKAGTVLLTRKNTPQLVGDSAYVSESAETYLPDLIWELSPRECVNARWLNHWLQTSEFRKQVSRLCVGSSKSMVGISQEAFIDSPVSIPPPAEQERIVAVLDPWDEAIDQVDLAITAIRNCYRGELDSIMAKHAGEPRRLDEICNVNVLSLPAKTDPGFEFDYFELLPLKMTAKTTCPATSHSNLLRHGHGGWWRKKASCMRPFVRYCEGSL
jgi:type I restriction enzyme S subunit